MTRVAGAFRERGKLLTGMALCNASCAFALSESGHPAKKRRFAFMLKRLIAYVCCRTLRNDSDMSAPFQGTGTDACRACADAKPDSCDAACGGLQAAGAAARARGDGSGTFRVRIGRTTESRLFP